MIEQILTTVATAETAEKANLFSSLGIDWKLLVLQTIAFLILLVVLRKWVYPPLVAMLDKRDADLKASADAAQEAKQAADRAESEVASLLQEAKHEAADIVATAKAEATAMVDAAEEKSKKKSEALLAAAQTDIENEVKAARDQLRNEMIDLVSLATEKVVGKTVSAKVDSDMIAQSIKEAGK